MTRTFLIFLALSVPQVFGCVGTIDGRVDPPPTPPPAALVFCNNAEAPARHCPLPSFDVREKLATCAGDSVLGGCHAGANRATEFELDVTDASVDVRAALNEFLNEPATVCSSDVLVNAANPDCSFVLTKVTAQPKCGQRMPVQTTHRWSDDEIDCFRSWLHDNFAP